MLAVVRQHPARKIYIPFKGAGTLKTPPEILNAEGDPAVSHARFARNKLAKLATSRPLVGMPLADVAMELGVSTSAVCKALSRHMST